jgi:hypothetical protein
VSASLLQNNGVGTDGPRVPRFKSAYEGCLPDMLALEREKLLKLNLDIPTIVTLALGAMSEIQKLKPACEANFKLMDLTLFDSLEARALALGYANALLQAASVQTLPVQELSARVVAVRSSLESDLRAAARRELVDEVPLQALKGNVGYKNQATDTLLLTALARGNWARLEGKTPITLAELDEAEVLADQLLTTVGEREQLPVVEAAASDIRQRAYTQFVNSYEEIRRWATPLRWHHGDLDKWIPSLYLGRNKRGSGEANGQPPVLEPAVEGSSADSHASGVLAPVTAPASTVAPGMPGADPFIRSAG